MTHILLISFFTLVFTRYLSWELKQKISYKKHSMYFFIAIGCTLTAYILTAFLDPRVGNFVYHGLGGGTASAFLYYYIKRTFSFRLSWRLDLLALFAFTSTLGVLNELAEYAVELTGYATLSFDTHDTWRDFTANTLGMLLGWLVIKSVKLLAKNRGK